MTPDHLAAAIKHLKTLQSVHLSVEHGSPRIERLFKAFFPYWLTPFTSTRSLFIAFDIGEKGEWIPFAWFEGHLMLVDERVGRKATRSVVRNKHTKGRKSHCYYAFVLKWEAGNKETGLFCARRARGTLAGEYGRGVEWKESLVRCVCSP
jgi:hypothetical protein